MAATPTTNKELGFTAPEFNLLDVVSDNRMHSNDLMGSKGTVFMFICNHCPFVIHVREALIRMALDYQNNGIKFIAISSNDVENYPQDGPAEMKKLAQELNFPFPYLFDETQEVAKAYDAACTPDFSIFDHNKQCVYRGQLDDARPGNGLPVDGHSIRTVLDQMIQNLPVDKENQKPSIGCNIKWKN
ncbi:MAG: thioredoxin family protein [Saprospiraceae bacterium]